jgi:hypothetical protein
MLCKLRHLRTSGPGKKTCASLSCTSASASERRVVGRWWPEKTGVHPPAHSNEQCHADCTTLGMVRVSGSDRQRNCSPVLNQGPSDNHTTVRGLTGNVASGKVWEVRIRCVGAVCRWYYIHTDLGFQPAHGCHTLRQVRTYSRRGSGLYMTHVASIPNGAIHQITNPVHMFNPGSRERSLCASCAH